LIGSPDGLEEFILSLFSPQPDKPVKAIDKDATKYINFFALLITTNNSIIYTYKNLIING
ncbi:hypothetical protein CJI50_01555, partial [Bifidobacteriaceae bacterium NR021]